MAVTKVEVQVAQQTQALMAGLVDFVLTTKTALGDGWQTTTDLPVEVMTAVKDLVPVIGALSSVEGEWKEDRAAVVRAVFLGAVALVDAILPKTPASPGA